MHVVDAECVSIPVILFGNVFYNVFLYYFNYLGWFTVSCHSWGSTPFLIYVMWSVCNNTKIQERNLLQPLPRRSSTCNVTALLLIHACLCNTTYCCTYHIHGRVVRYTGQTAPPHTRFFYIKPLLRAIFTHTRVDNSTSIIHSFLGIPENSGKLGKISPKTCRTEFPGISGNFFRGFPGIPEIPGNFSGNLGVFSRTRAAEQGTRR